MLRAIFSKPYSQLMIIGDNSGWSTDIDAQDLKLFATRLGVPAHIIKRAYLNLPQVFHYTSQFSLMDESIYHSKAHISVDYYHGKPKQTENERESFTKCFQALQTHHEQIYRVRVSNKEMEDLIKSSGINPDKVMRIPIGIDSQLFTPQTADKKRETRNRLGIPQGTVVVGSFQKDGVGWDEGNEPKLIKGPDIFLKVIDKLKQDVPNLFVLLSGPSRGYVKNGLDKLGVPYKHEYLKDFRKLPELYDALDLYIITSREEGGPKACLESMVKGVPLVTTEVGQCKDLVTHAKNAMMAPQEDSEKLAQYAREVISDSNLRDVLLNEGFKTAKANSFDNQLPLWQEYFHKLIN